MTTNKEKLGELTSLKARALKAYATKDYPQSADLYAQACELQTEIQGEDNPANAHLLYLYGRSLYKVAIGKSDVLGAGAGGSSEEKGKPAAASGSKSKGKEAAVTLDEEKEKSVATAKKASGLFQFTGDENYDDSDDNEEEGSEEGVAQEEEEDEMGAAWEVLDLARVFFEKQLAANANPSTENHPPPMTEPQVKDTKTMLADVYDLLGEVSLESENFPQATKDFDSALTLKNELYPIESTLISEAEFKMALALEFSSSDDAVSKADAEKLREAAAGHIEKSIASCQARIAVEEVKIAEAAAKGEDDEGKGKAVESKESKEIEDVKGMIAELEQRLQDLRNPPEADPDQEAFTGLLGQILGGGEQHPSKAREALERAMQGANDLSSLVRKKENPAASTSAEGSNGGKRKLDYVAEEQQEEEESSKKAKVEDTVDSGL